MKHIFTEVDAKILGESIGINFESINIHEFCKGLSVELEHGKIDPETNVTNDDMGLTAKIAWAHLKELPDYYAKLQQIENDS